VTAAQPFVIVGPTASGKSDVAMALAGRHPDAELVAVDAMQVYRRMDIGTAKPTVADRAAVPHHCLDLVDPSEEFTVSDFTTAAEAALTGIADRGHRAVLVAGTGLYLRSITDPMDVPGRWPDVRADLDRRAATEGSAALHRGWLRWGRRTEKVLRPEVPDLGPPGSRQPSQPGHASPARRPHGRMP